MNKAVKAVLDPILTKTGFIKAVEMIYADIKSKEPKITKKTGFNLDKTDMTENDSNKLFSAKGALNLFNNFTNVINEAKDDLTVDIIEKLDKGTYTGTAQEIVDMINRLNVCPYRIGDILKTTSTISPNISWVGTTWEKIEGRFLMGTSGDEMAGSVGGVSEIKLSDAHMPPHGHDITVVLQASEKHRHLVDEHTHTNLAHFHGTIGENSTIGSGPYGLYNTSNANFGLKSTMDWDNSTYKTSTDGGTSSGLATPYTSEEDGHTHNVTATMTTSGLGQSFSVVPPYYKVYVWKRIS